MNNQFVTLKDEHGKTHLLSVSVIETILEEDNGSLVFFKLQDQRPVKYQTNISLVQKQLKKLKLLA